MAFNKRVVAVAALSLIFAVAAMFRDQVVLNTGSAVCRLVSTSQQILQMPST